MTALIIAFENVTVFTPKDIREQTGPHLSFSHDLEMMDSQQKQYDGTYADATTDDLWTVIINYHGNSPCLQSNFELDDTDLQRFMPNMLSSEGK